MYQQGVASKWLKLGKKWMMFIQDTNALALKTLPSALGVSASKNLLMNSICVPRKPGEAMGAICKFEDKLTINVEYNQLDGLLREKYNPDGDVPNDEGYSNFPGNTNTLVFKLAEYVDELNRSKGVIPEFVNPKYANEEKTLFKSPTRLECMMQDYPKLLSSAEGVGFSTYDYWFCFSPAKNSVEASAKCIEQGIPSYGAAEAEFNYYNWARKMFEIAGYTFHET